MLCQVYKRAEKMSDNQELYVFYDFVIKNSRLSVYMLSSGFSSNQLTVKRNNFFIDYYIETDPSR